MTQLIYVVRRSEQYKKTHQVDEYFENTWHVCDNIADWNDTFDMPWEDYRNRLEDLRRQNMRDLQFDKYCDFHELKDMCLDDCIVVPTDDDDWFHPELCQTLRASPLMPLYRWFHCVIRWTGSGPQMWTERQTGRRNYGNESNNYAMYEPQQLESIDWHYYQSTGPLWWIPKFLSVHHQHLGSASLLNLIRVINRNSERLSKSAYQEVLKKNLELYRKPPVLNAETPPYFFRFFDKLTHIYSQINIRRL